MAFWSRVRPLAAATVPLVASTQLRPPARAEEKTFVPLKVMKTEQHTHNTKKVTLECGGALAGKGAIQNVLLKAPVAGSTCCGCCKCGPGCGCPKGPSGCCGCCSCGPNCGCPRSGTGETVRPYNPLSLGDGGTLTLLVKKYEKALMGTYVHDLKVGDTVEVKGPNQQAAIAAGKYKEYGMIAGGTGITPLVQATDFILRNDTAKVTVVCLNQSQDDMLLVDELQALRNEFPARLVVEHVVARGPGPRVGVATPELLRDLLPPASPQVRIMVCGPGAMTAAVAGPKAKDYSQGELAGMLKELGYQAEHVLKV